MTYKVHISHLLFFIRSNKRIKKYILKGKKELAHFA